jgi:hypothetical protein
MTGAYSLVAGSKHDHSIPRSLTGQGNNLAIQHALSAGLAGPMGGVLEKCGFQQEGYLRKHYFKDSQYLDSRLFALLKE